MSNDLEPRSTELSAEIPWLSIEQRDDHQVVKVRPPKFALHRKTIGTLWVYPNLTKIEILGPRDPAMIGFVLVCVLGGLFAWLFPGYFLRVPAETAMVVLWLAAAASWAFIPRRSLLIGDGRVQVFAKLGSAPVLDVALASVRVEDGRLLSDRKGFAVCDHLDGPPGDYMRSQLAHEIERVQTYESS